MWLAGPEVLVPVPDRIAGVQDRADLVVLAQIPQPTVVVDVARRRQHRCAHHGTLGASRAVLTASTPPGSATTSTASPPAAGNRHNAAGGLSSSSVGRTATNNRSPSDGERRRRLALGAAGQASCRALPCRVEFPDRGDVFGALVVEFADRRHHPRSVRRYRQPGHPRQREVVVEIAERVFGHATFVAQRVVSLIFKLTSWHTDAMTTIPLADLPGRPCPIAAALALVGERWALLVVREIALGATRFSDIVAGTGAPRDRIAARLKALESAGVVARSAVPRRPGPLRIPAHRIRRRTLAGSGCPPRRGESITPSPRRPRSTTQIPTDERTESEGIR